MIEPAAPVEDSEPKKKPNAGWKKLDEFNRKRYVNKVKRERDSGLHP